MLSPNQAIADLIGEQFIDWINQYVPQEMQSWAILEEMSTTQSKSEKIKKFVLQVFLANEAFLGSREGDPGFLRFAIANLSESDDPLAETALTILENRRTEELVGHSVEQGILKTKSREQWVILLLTLGFSPEEIERAEPKEPTRNFIAELSEIYSTGEWQTAVGAFAAYDISENVIRKAMQQMLVKLGLNHKDLEILNTENNSSMILEKVTFDLESKELVWQGVMRQLEIRKEFLTDLEKYLV
ncbi:MAG: hypothetical protein A3K07_02565 [Candidatus Doudnabacteria bacterium RIFCSPHIGHO2_01_43_10]|nr:MAG: hypothetical protein A3K07_02565 [Candidatus Doudnabacteria bacterium RIFCSPHIGHO2_01_43_10]